ncbi:sensor histidine kinase [Kutzneria sp. 744]|uniref:sensor histidine kinase n=1 Tax=Kutzneria sp. (strain 744) TaxID=345341 RepID=UPI0006945855|nr:histidine kinase [Kutzneria sp. 744]
MQEILVVGQAVVSTRAPAAMADWTAKDPAPPASAWINTVSPGRTSSRRTMGTASAAGFKLRSGRSALIIAISGAVVAAGASRVVHQLAPEVAQLPWWLVLTVALPVCIGTAQRDRLHAVRSARIAAEESRRARESEAREAALVERSRIAREVHDLLGHSLSWIALQLDMADALRCSGREDEATAAIRKARALAVDSINETSRAVHALRDGALPLPEALRKLAEHTSVRFVVIGEATQVGADAALTIVRTAQEVLTKAAKYAPGAARDIRLGFAVDRITPTAHNGPATEPFRADLARGSGVGLVGLRERAALLGGTLHAGPSDNGGWTVELELPR